MLRLPTPPRSALPETPSPPMPRTLAVLMAKKIAEPDRLMTAFLFMLLRETFRETFVFQRSAIQLSPPILQGA